MGVGRRRDDAFWILEALTVCDPSMGVLRYYSSVTQSGPDSDNDDVITELQRPADGAGAGAGARGGRRDSHVPPWHSGARSLGRLVTDARVRGDAAQAARRRRDVRVREIGASLVARSRLARRRATRGGLDRTYRYPVIWIVIVSVQLCTAKLLFFSQLFF